MESKILQISFYGKFHSTLLTQSAYASSSEIFRHRERLSAVTGQSLIPPEEGMEDIQEGGLKLCTFKREGGGTKNKEHLKEGVRSFF